MVNAFGLVVEPRLLVSMEEELRCPVCKQVYSNPVLLPCYHALCLPCAVVNQQPASAAPGLHPVAAPGPGATAGAGAGTGAGTAGGAAVIEAAESVASSSSSQSQETGEYQEVDKLSILSETDSGVVCTSRPNSYVGTPSLQGILFPPLSTSALSLACPICQKLVYFDENGAHNLPRYRVMQTIVDKYSDARQDVPLKCQMCESEPAADATVMCEQCSVLYCDGCRESCHPARGPLAKHTLLEARRGATRSIGRLTAKDGKCPEHDDEVLSMYCMVCKQAVCALCLHDTRHTSHDVQAIAAMCKAQKVIIIIDIIAIFLFCFCFNTMLAYKITGNDRAIDATLTRTIQLFYNRIYFVFICFT